MPDLDQGGTYRQWMLQALGPSVGKVVGPLQNVLQIASAGTYTLDRNTNNVQVNVAGAVTIVLPPVLYCGRHGRPGLLPEYADHHHRRWRPCRNESDHDPGGDR